MTVRLAVPAVIAPDGRLDQAGTLFIAAARDEKPAVAGMRAAVRHCARPDALAQMPLDGIPHERAQFLVLHQTSDKET
jgi:hypothetical protein